MEHVRRMVLVSALLGVVGVGSLVVNDAGRSEAKFCTMGLAMMKSHRSGAVIFQDQGSPGQDGCDEPDHEDDRWVLGFDCHLRAPGGKVVATVEPNESDGTCDLAAPIPASWYDA